MRLTESRSWTFLPAVLLAVTVSIVIANVALAADAPPKGPPVLPVSKFAPAEDLTGQVEYYLKRLGQAVETKEDYEDFAERISKDSNTLIVIALSLGLHNTDNQYKAAAPAIMSAAQELAGTKDYAAAKVGVERVKKAATVKGNKPADLQWGKVASLKQLMLAVPAVNTQLKRNAKLRRPKRDGPKAAGRAATIGVIGQASMYHSDDTKKPKLKQPWWKYCVEMRDAAAEINQAARKADKKSARAAMKKLAESCENCHKVFEPEAQEKVDAEQ